MTEEWRPVVDFEGLYEVSDRGNVRRLPGVIVRSNGAPQTIPQRDMKTVTTKHGYKSLHLSKDGVATGHLVHRLVARAFLGEPPLGKELVLHGQGGPGDNRVENIRWGSYLENMKDAVKDGTADFWGHKRNPKPNCPAGHPYSGQNLYVDPGGRRVCRTCKREWARRKYGYSEDRFRVQ